MSASNKKKLRKEQSAANITEKQRDELNENKKLRSYSVAFTAVIVVIVIAALAILGSTFVKRSGVLQKKTVAAVVEGQELNSVELSYYYNNAINSTYNKWASAYGDNIGLYTQLMGIDITKPLNEQKYAEGDTTWADFFVDQAVETAESDYVLCKMAETDGYELSAEDQEEFDHSMDRLHDMVIMSGFKNLNEYLKTVYGPGSNEETYREYSRRSALATAYLRDHVNALSYEDADIRAYDNAHHNEFSSYSFADYYVSSSAYLEGGEKDEDGNVTYTEEEKAAALEKAKTDAEALAKSSTVDALDKAIAALPVNAENEHAVTEKNTNALYSMIDIKEVQDWVTDSSRKENEVGVVPAESTTKDEDGNETTVTNGYYVIFFQGADENLMPMGNVRHLLVAFEGGTADDNGVKTYSDEEKAAAKKKAEDILNEWKSGDATEESFIDLVKEKTSDTASAENGGLFENINPGSNLVKPFRDWALDASHKPGDTDIVETEYGYHIMYNVGASEQTYRDYMIENALRSADADAWYESIMEPAKSEKKDTSLLNMAYIMKPAR